MSQQQHTMPHKQSQRRINWLRIIILNLLVASIGFAIVKRLREHPYNQREINKRYLNPLMAKTAGRRTSTQGLIHHVGRKSGRSYETPIQAIPIPNGFVIPLPYGSDVDWCRNLLAAQSGTLQWHGETYHLVAPEIVATTSILAELQPFQRTIMRLLKVEHTLKMQMSTDPVANASPVQ
jgi:deazaflavin-dependent oxidoreductase (nitroreductase family)